MVLSYNLFDGLDGEDSSDSEDEEEHRDENMVDQDLDWMTQGPLDLLSILHKMPRHPEKLLMKYVPDNSIKAEDHLDNFYLHLQTLEVRYGDVACKLFLVPWRVK